MLIANVEAVAKSLKKNRPVAAAFMVWVEIATAADWSSLQDVRKDFPAADGVAVGDGTIVTVFNFKGNSYRLLTTISYNAKLVAVIAMLTHAEYSKDRWK